VLSFLQRHKGLVVVGTLLILPLVLLYAQTRRGGAHGPVVAAVLEVSSVIERGVLWATDGITDGLEHWVTSVSSWPELARLRQERVARTALEDRIAELSMENEALRALANAAGAIDGPRPIGARVIGRRGQPLTKLVVVDKGARHGVRRGDGVISADGVVGVVLTVARTSAEVLLFSDAAAALDILVQRSRARGILRGSGDHDRYAAVVEDFDRLRDVRPGDVVVTSGFGARFPPGTRVGTIAEVKDRDDLNVEALIVPATNLARVEHVAVLVGREAPLPPALGDAGDDYYTAAVEGGAPGRREPTPASAEGNRRKRRERDDGASDGPPGRDAAPPTEKPAEQPATDKPTTDKPTTDKPTTDKPTTDKPTTDKPTTDKPTTDKPTTDKPADKPTTDKPTTDKPADKPADKAGKPVPP
jgi:rod shape-determining protein MreC